jgi:hypothetical protein
MQKNLMWFFAVLLTMVITTITVQYFWSGNLNPAYLLGVVLGSVIAWIIISTPRRPWVYWVGMLFWAIFVPAGLLGLIRLFVSLLSIALPTWADVAIYLLGVLAILLFFIYNNSRIRIEEIGNRPFVDERYQYHYGLSGFWAFLFLNLLIIGALLQPWVPQGQLGLWIGVLIASLVFWGINLLILEQNR